MQLKTLICGWGAVALLHGALGAEALDAKVREETVHAVARVLVEHYTFPDVAEQMAQSLREHLERGDYSRITNGPALAKRLTDDLRAISHDKHLNVHYTDRMLQRGAQAEDPSPAEAAAFREDERRANGGLDKVEVLPGNIGYLHLRYFGIAAVAGPRIAGAMDFLSGTDALIIDIRDNSGAIDPGSIAILCSYFFPEGRVHLNSLVWRRDNRVEQSWTLPLLPGPRYLDKPVYVLTSGRTFSGAEEFAYNLQTRQRATIVGARTGGGANPGGDRAVSEHFTVWVPTGRALNPVTGTNWEGTGVSPDVEMKPAKAVLGAQKMAIETLLARGSADERWDKNLHRRLAELARELNRPAEKVTFRLPGFNNATEASVVGSFNDWTVGADPLRRGTDCWSTTLALEPGRHAYKLFVDGQWLLDPHNPHTEVTSRGHTNSVIQVEAAAR